MLPSRKDNGSNDRRNPWRVMSQVAVKEMLLFLSSPIAWLFLACYAAITLFIVFWGEAYFARNIADIRPMFEWMPVILILLCSTLTMKMWSEERRTGTLEHVLTQSAPLWTFAVGKYLACMGLLLLSLLIVLPLPLSMSLISDIDWGPVMAGFVATLMLGSAYLAIGLYVSSRTQNQIVSLIGAVALCGAFYLIGLPVVTNTFGQWSSELLQALGTGSRFAAITRGVIDISDLIYYISLTLIFLVLTIYTLEHERWSQNRRNNNHRRWQVATSLLILNAIALNLWIGHIDSWRVDTTRGKQYSLSDATRNYLAQLREPLTLRGYFSGKTHPLLSPLVPQMRDLLREYEVAGNGRVRVEIIDPMQSPEAEEEANQQYGIEPVPFQVADRYQSSIVSSYFDVLVQYGDEFDVLGFRDLIEIKSQSETNIDVQLRNPEYDLTRSIRRVLTDFQSAGNVFTNINTPVTLTAYISSDDRLPADLIGFRSEVTRIVSEIQQRANGNLKLDIIDPMENGATIAEQLARDYGLRPMRASLFGDDTFWFHLLLSAGDQIVQLPLDDLSAASFETNLEAGLKRYAKGFTRKIAFVAGSAPDNRMGAQPGVITNGNNFRTLEEYLKAEYAIISEELSDGTIASDADLLLIAAPSNLDEKALFAIDQFLMQGGTVIAATSKWTADLSRTRLDLQEKESGLNDWLVHHGIEIGDAIVMDPHNAAFPLPVTRNVGGLQLQEMRMLDYPYFVDIRRNGLNKESPIVAGLDQVTMAWASPVTFTGSNAADSTGRSNRVLLESSDQSWTSSSTDIMPRLDNTNRGLSSWLPEGEPAAHPIAVASTGRFESYFAGKPSPLAEGNDTEQNNGNTEIANDTGNALDSINELAAEIGSTVSSGDDKSNEAEVESEPTTLASNVDTLIERSPESARLIVFGSNDFLRDQITQLAGSASGTAYLAPFQLVANAVDVALDDTGLLSIRNRGQFNRTLPPMNKRTQQFWEYLNYAMAALAIVLVYGATRLLRRRTEQKQLNWFAT